MKEKYKKKINKKIDLLDVYSHLNFKFVMIYIIHKMLLLIKNHLHYLKDSILNAFSMSIIDFYFLKKNNFFFHNI